MAKEYVVHFNETLLCEYHTGAVMDYIDEVLASDIWYQHNDLQQMKRRAMVLSKEANRYGLGSLLTNTYGRSDNETQRSMNTWARSCSSRRGLERFINNEYSAKRSDIRRRTIKSVIRAQRKMKEEGVLDVDYGMKVLSRLSEAFSQDSRNFARMMGIADEFALQELMSEERGTTSGAEAAGSVAGSKDGIKSNCSSDDDDNDETSDALNEAFKSIENIDGQSPVSTIQVRPFTTPSSHFAKLPQRRNLGLSAATSNTTRSVNDLRHYC